MKEPAGAGHQRDETERSENKTEGKRGTMEHQYEDEIEIDLKELLFEFKKKLWLIILAAIAGCGLFGAFSALVLQPQYTSSSMLYVLSKETTLTSLADLQIGTQLTNDYQVLVSSRPVLDVVIEELGLELDYEEMTRKLEIENPTDTRILTLTVTDGDPVMAKTIVDAITDRVSEYIGDIMEMEAPKIIEYGQVSMEPVSPNVMRNAAIGGVLGIVAVCGIVTLMVVMNDTVRTEDDVEKYLGLSTLAVIPAVDRKHPDKPERGKKRSERSAKREPGRNESGK